MNFFLSLFFKNQSSVLSSHAVDGHKMYLELRL